jgi:hypothetical protein
MTQRYDFYGRITQESIERMRRRIGVRMPAVPAWYREARIRGVVTAKNDDGTVEVKVSCVNQDEIDTCPGDATIALPTRDRPHPDFSDVPADWVGPRGQS